MKGRAAPAPKPARPAQAAPAAPAASGRAAAGLPRTTSMNSVGSAASSASAASKTSAKQATAQPGGQKPPPASGAKSGKPLSQPDIVLSAATGMPMEATPRRPPPQDADESMLSSMEGLARRVRLLERELTRREMLYRVTLRDISSKYNAKILEIQEYFNRELEVKDLKITQMCQVIEQENQRMLESIQGKDDEIKALRSGTAAAAPAPAPTAPAAAPATSARGTGRGVTSSSSRDSLGGKKPAAGGAGAAAAKKPGAAAGRPVPGAGATAAAAATLAAVAAANERKEEEAAANPAAAKYKPNLVADILAQYRKTKAERDRMVEDFKGKLQRDLEELKTKVESMSFEASAKIPDDVDLPAAPAPAPSPAPARSRAPAPAPESEPEPDPAPASAGRPRSRRITDASDERVPPEKRSLMDLFDGGPDGGGGGDGDLEWSQRLEKMSVAERRRALQSARSSHSLHSGGSNGRDDEEDEDLGKPQAKEELGKARSLLRQAYEEDFNA